MGTRLSCAHNSKRLRPCLLLVLNMAAQLQYVFRYDNFHIDKKQPLGQGSYGAVYKAKCDQLPCAAKILHPIIQDPRDAGAFKIRQRFEQECAFLGRIRHPHIVQYLGTTVDPESGHLVLLMELLDESLRKMLERSREMLNFHVQVDICHDISLAVAYLHSNDIIHRDLSSNNVLIIAGRRAKVTDFGMSKLVGGASNTTPLTACPGTQLYMPPETLRDPPMYTKKLDCFSEGVLMIQVCTRLSPEPGPRTRLTPDPTHTSPNGTIEIPVRETERRRNHIDLIDLTHPLLPIAVECLNYEEDRPSAEWICESLATIKGWADYGNSVLQSEEADSDVAGLRKQVKELQVTKEKNSNHIKKQMKQLQEKDQQLTLLQQQNTQLKRESEAKSAPQKRPLHQYHTLDATPRGNSLPQHLRTQVPQSIKMKLKWGNGLNVPLDMKRGAAVVDGEVAYFVDMTKKCVCSYDSSAQKWATLPECPYFGSSLAIVNGLLTAIGGTRNYKPTSKLFSFITEKNAKLEEGTKKWEERFPAMPTARYYAMAVSTGKHLVVAGGEKAQDKHLDTVEILNSDTLIWSTAASLLHPFSKASAAIYGDHLYMLGGEDNSRKTRSVLTCSLTDLLHVQLKKPTPVWHQIADTPAFYSTCAAVGGELLAVGGQDADLDKDTTAIYQYNLMTDSWHLISHMPTPRSRCLVASFSAGELMAVGGSLSCIQMIEMNIVEIATIA